MFTSKTIRFSRGLFDQVLIKKRTCTTFTPVSRKNNKLKTDDSSTYLFQDVATSCLLNVKRALEPMLPLNEEFLMSFENNELILDVGSKGTFILNIGKELKIFAV